MNKESGDFMEIGLEQIRKEYNLWRYNAEQGFPGRLQDLADAENLE